MMNMRLFEKHQGHRRVPSPSNGLSTIHVPSYDMHFLGFEFYHKYFCKISIILGAALLTVLVISSGSNFSLEIFEMYVYKGANHKVYFH